MKLRLIILILILILNGSIATAQNTGYRTLHPDDVYHEYQSQVYAFMIDVRMKMEYKRGHIEGAINIPQKARLEHFSDTVDLETPVYLYCTTTTRSTSAAEFLISKGFQSVTIIDGGYRFWSTCELPVLRKKKKKKV